MSRQLNAYLMFDGTAREAMTFYRSLFGGELEVTTFGDLGMEGAPAEGVMHSQLTTADGWVLMASDLPPGMESQPGGNITLCLNGDDEEHLRGLFEALCEGGEVHVELEKQVWGDWFGQCRDRFGTTWMANITPADAAAPATA